jgi:hypothetical protein
MVKSPSISARAHRAHCFNELDAGTLAERFGVAELAQVDDTRFVDGLAAECCALSQGSRGDFRM